MHFVIGELRGRAKEIWTERFFLPIPKELNP